MLFEAVFERKYEKEKGIKSPKEKENIMAERFHIFFSSSAEYFSPLCVTLGSILVHNTESVLFQFNVMDAGLRDDQKEYLMAIYNTNFSTLKIHTVDLEILGDLKDPGPGYISKATYLRLFVPKIVEPNVDRALLMDVDTLVKGSLKELATMDLGDKLLWAVEDHYRNYIEHNGEGTELYRDFIRLDNDATYFNAGILLYNTGHQETPELFDRFIKQNQTFIDEGIEIEFSEQDILNRVCQCRVGILSPTWNFQSAAIKRVERNQSYNVEEYRKIVRNPTIIHYSNSVKPWASNASDSPHIKVPEYRKYLYFWPEQHKLLWMSPTSFVTMSRLYINQQARLLKGEAHEEFELAKRKIYLYENGILFSFVGFLKTIVRKMRNVLNSKKRSK